MTCEESSEAESERRLKPSETHRDEAGIGTDGRLEQLQVDQTILLDGEVGNFEALVLQDSARVENALVLGLSGDAVDDAVSYSQRRT